MGIGKSINAPRKAKNIGILYIKLCIWQQNVQKIAQNANKLKFAKKPRTFLNSIRKPVILSPIRKLN